MTATILALHLFVPLNKSDYCKNQTNNLQKLQLFVQSNTRLRIVFVDEQGFYFDFFFFWCRISLCFVFCIGPYLGFHCWLPD